MGWGPPAATGTPLNDSRWTLESEGIALRDSSGGDWRWSAPRPTGTAWTFRTAGNAGVLSWDGGAPDPRLLLPVRRPRSGALSRHIPVRAFSTTTGAHIALGGRQPVHSVHRLGHDRGEALGAAGGGRHPHARSQGRGPAGLEQSARDGRIGTGDRMSPGEAEKRNGPRDLPTWPLAGGLHSGTS